MEIAALVSGGVDSSVVVHQLKEAGYDPTIFYIRIGMEDKDGYIDCPAEEDIEITSYIARKYGCRMEVVSLHDEYWDKVVSYTIDSVKRGLTPNPDMMCNKFIKFGCFEEKWGKDFDKIATGQRPGEGPDRFPGTNHTPANPEADVPDRPPDESGSPCHRCRTKAPQRHAQGQPRHLLPR